MRRYLTLAVLAAFCSAVAVVAQDPNDPANWATAAGIVAAAVARDPSRSGSRAADYRSDPR